jgi:predicted transcriptional regulator
MPTPRISVSIPTALQLRLRRLARLDDLSSASVIRNAIAVYCSGRESGNIYAPAGRPQKRTAAARTMPK